MKSLSVLDIFSGIGGFSLGLERAGMSTVSFCEIEEYPRRVLEKRWPDTPIHSDIRTLRGEDYRGVAQVICGGFPCQDISVSGKQKGLSGRRSGLWGEYKRVISEGAFDYAIIENVANLRSNGLTTVLQDLWEIGYDAIWHIIPAQALGAKHERERIWIIAYPNSAQREGRSLSSRIQKEISNLSDFCGGKDKPGVVRTLDGVPYQMDRLKALGNSVYPAIPEAIGRAILKQHNWGVQ